MRDSGAQGELCCASQWDMMRGLLLDPSAKFEERSLIHSGDIKEFKN